MRVELINVLLYSDHIWHELVPISANFFFKNIGLKFLTVNNI